MSRTNRFATFTHIKPAARARLLELREDLVAIQNDKANRKRILDEARARDAEWADYVQAVRPLKQGKLWR